MAQLVEFHGRLSGGGPPSVSPRALRFSLHADTDEAEPLWTEDVEEVEIDGDGGFHVVLGLTSPLNPAWFAQTVAWLAVEDLTTGATAPRAPLTGGVLRLAAAMDDLEARLTRVEGAVTPVPAGLTELQRRLARLDDDDGRLVRIEDELEDITGPDGDLIDLLERVERLEGSGPVPRPAPPPAPIARADPRFVAQLAERLEALGARLSAVEGLVAKGPGITAETLHVVKRSGDTMTGGLVINRGGLEVLSGGVKCRGADVNTLEASIQVKAPKVITDALELRGDLTVDNTRRTLQVRHLEGRAGGSRKDGALMLNARSGAEVVVGNDEARAGLSVCGAISADGVTTPGAALASTFAVDGEVEPGDVCAVTERGLIGRCGGAEQGPVVGVCVRAAAVAGGAAGEGRVLVAWGGLATVRVTGAVAPGDLLVASGLPGRATRSPDGPLAGTVLGRALSASRGDEGEISALITPR